MKQQKTYYPEEVKAASHAIKGFIELTHTLSKNTLVALTSFYDNENWNLAQTAACLHSELFHAIDKKLTTEDYPTGTHSVAKLIKTPAQKRDPGEIGRLQRYYPQLSQSLLSQTPTTEESKADDGYDTTTPLTQHIFAGLNRDIKSKYLFLLCVKDTNIDLLYEVITKERHPDLVAKIIDLINSKLLSPREWDTILSTQIYGKSLFLHAVVSSSILIPHFLAALEHTAIELISNHFSDIAKICACCYLTGKLDTNTMHCIYAIMLEPHMMSHYINNILLQPMYDDEEGYNIIQYSQYYCPELAIYLFALLTDDTEFNRFDMLNTPIRLKWKESDKNNIFKILTSDNRAIYSSNINKYIPGSLDAKSQTRTIQIQLLLERYIQLKTAEIIDRNAHDSISSNKKIQLATLVLNKLKETPLVDYFKPLLDPDSPLLRMDNVTSASRTSPSSNTGSGAGAGAGAGSTANNITHTTQNKLGLFAQQGSTEVVLSIDQTLCSAYQGALKTLIDACPNLSIRKGSIADTSTTAYQGKSGEMEMTSMSSSK